MASKFQNRLVGTVILVAVGVIVLPSLLDGQKQHYQDEFASIPLVPKPGDSDELDMLPPATQALPAQPPEGAGDEVKASSVPSSSLSDAANVRDQVIAREEVSSPREQPKPPVEKPKVVEKTPVKPVAEATKTNAAADKPPVGQGFVVQVGALKNADKVNEITAKLRAAGYKVYTLPSVPVQDSVTRIMVGPDASREKLNSALGELRALSGLPGAYIMRFNP